ncbi:RNA polymerase factor sigma-70 [Fictibacillus macauensis ZFHKF-1]|uniref:RNA polymerase factor sigma-70 n=1 Tax=Fictibacillus macauensis ZFHKF-1 TaxID=1196324 RepID=I8UAE7_9BACL|nr:sigma-70 family RNA polymerase sigma factor [Fictibacillus macauensis]EIT83920.1 RNA polymerase factor sigma-70 [Fictibacillus macauensis ZFHKF-1]
MEFETLAEQFEPLIKSQIRKLGVARQFEEYYQIGLIALWQASTRFKEEKGDFGPFAYQTVRGMMLSHLRNERKHQQETTLTAEQADAISAPSVSMPSDLEEWSYYLAQLTANQQQWVIKKIIYGMKESEIAEAAGVTIGAVKSWRRQALTHLRKLLHA